jgi:hypothetical protein
LILEEEVGLPPAPKEAVPVPFICNLRGFGCPLSADTISPSQWYIDGKLAKQECELVLSQEVCTTQEPGQAMGSTPLETNRAMAEVHEGKSLAAWAGSFARSPTVNSRELWFLSVVFRSPNTKDALSSLKKILLLFIFCVQRAREAGAFLVRKTKPARGLHQRQLINGERIGQDRSSPPLDSISN